MPRGKSLFFRFALYKRVRNVDENGAETVVLEKIGNFTTLKDIAKHTNHSVTVVGNSYLKKRVSTFTFNYLVKKLETPIPLMSIDDDVTPE